MIKDNIKALINMIFIVLLLLGLCISVDYADENDTITNADLLGNDSVKLNDTHVVNGTYYVGVEKEDKVTEIDKVVTEKPKLPIITATGKPSCRCGRYSSYTWRTRSYINYCPHCKHYNVLYDAHKWPARFEKELTCKRCGADYCINCGHEKYSWSHVYLRKA